MPAPRFGASVLMPATGFSGLGPTAIAPIAKTVRDWPDDVCAGSCAKNLSPTSFCMGTQDPVHALAIQGARQFNLRVHVFEEGYLRPYWVTYERDGCNGHSKLMAMRLSDMSEALQTGSLDEPAAPAHWGEMRHHMFYGALYHFFVLFLNQAYPKFQHHRPHRVRDEFRQHLRKLFWMPLSFVRRGLATLHGYKPLAFPTIWFCCNYNMTARCKRIPPSPTMPSFSIKCSAALPKGRPGITNWWSKRIHVGTEWCKALSATLKNLAEKHQIIDRLRYIEGGKLAKILRQARSAVTVNSTAGQQALWRGIPLKLFGNAVYAKA